MRPSPLVGLTAGALVGLIVDDLGLTSAVSFWGDRGPLVLISALGCALLWTTRARRLVAGAAAALGVLWLLAAFTPLAGFLAKGLVRRDSPAPADAVFVAASSIQTSGELTVPSMSRLLHGIELVAEHQAPALVLSDLKSPYPSYAGAAKALLEHLGVTTELLTIAGPNENTHDEAVSLARTYRERGWKLVIVVTSPYHSRRACGAVEHDVIGVILILWMLHTVLSLALYDEAAGGADLAVVQLFLFIFLNCRSEAHLSRPKGRRACSRRRVWMAPGSERAASHSGSRIGRSTERGGVMRWMGLPSTA